MDLTSAERAVLKQLRDFHGNGPERLVPLTELTREWPAMHYEAYEDALAGLIGKGLVQALKTGRALRITDAGFAAMAPSDAGQGSRRRHEKVPPIAPAADEKDYSTSILRRKQLSIVGRLIFIAILVCALWLLWRFR